MLILSQEEHHENNMSRVPAIPGRVLGAGETAVSKQVPDVLAFLGI